MIQHSQINQYSQEISMQVQETQSPNNQPEHPFIDNNKDIIIIQKHESHTNTIDRPSR